MKPFGLIILISLRQNRKYTESLWIILRVWGSQSWSSSVSLRHSVGSSPIWKKKKKSISLARMDATPSPFSSGQTSSEGTFLFLNRIAFRWSLPQSNRPISTRSKWNSPLFEDCLPTSRETSPNFDWTRSISLLGPLWSDRGEENLYQRRTSQCTGPRPSGMTHDDLDQEGRRSERGELLFLFVSFSTGVRRSGSCRRWSSSGSLPFLSIKRKHRDIDEQLLHWWLNEEKGNQPSSSLSLVPLDILAIESLDLVHWSEGNKGDHWSDGRWWNKNQRRRRWWWGGGDNWHIGHGKRKRKSRHISLSICSAGHAPFDMNRLDNNNDLVSAEQRWQGELGDQQTDVNVNIFDLIGMGMGKVCLARAIELLLFFPLLRHSSLSQCPSHPRRILSVLRSVHHLSIIRSFPFGQRDLTIGPNVGWWTTLWWTSLFVWWNGDCSIDEFKRNSSSKQRIDLGTGGEWCRYW